MAMPTSLVSMASASASLSLSLSLSRARSLSPSLSLPLSLSLSHCVCARARARVCVRARAIVRVRARARECLRVRACACACVCVCVRVSSVGLPFLAGLRQPIRPGFLNPRAERVPVWRSDAKATGRPSGSGGSAGRRAGACSKRLTAGNPAAPWRGQHGGFARPG